MLSILIQQLLHELGKMIFGLCCGYRVFAWQLGPFWFIKPADRSVRTRAGFRAYMPRLQVHICPLDAGSLPPYRAYLLGGSWFLGFCGLVLLALSLMLTPGRFAFYLCLISGSLCVLRAIVSLLPLRLKRWMSPAYLCRALDIGKPKREALLSILYNTMLIREAEAEGLGLSQLPGHFFEERHDDESLWDYPLAAEFHELRLLRMLSLSDVYEAKDEIGTFLSARPALRPREVKRLEAELLFIEYCGERAPGALLLLEPPALKAYFRRHLRCLFALRLRYAKSLKEKDLARMRHYAGIYPFRGIAAEELYKTELIDFRAKF